VLVPLPALAQTVTKEKVVAALPKLEELTGPASLVTARAVSNLAALYWSSGKLEQAEPLALRAEAAFHDLPAVGPADRSPNRLILASIYLKQHRYADAESTFQQLSDRYERLYYMGLMHERRAKAKLGGGEERIAKQHAADKLTARERLDLLVDKGTIPPAIRQVAGYRRFARWHRLTRSRRTSSWTY